MKNLKKITLALLMVSSSLPILAIVLEPNTITNNTSIPITIETTRHVKCLGSNLQTITQSTTIGAGQTGKIYVQGGAQLGCMSNVTELKAEAPGYTSAILPNPTTKDYTVSVKIVAPPFSEAQTSESEPVTIPHVFGKITIPPPAVSITKKLVIE